MFPLLIAPRGGRLGEGSTSVAVERTYATMRSVEFDAVVLTEGIESSTEVDVLISEAWRHLKAIATCGDAECCSKNRASDSAIPGYSVQVSPTRRRSS